MPRYSIAKLGESKIIIEARNYSEAIRKAIVNVLEATDKIGIIWKDLHLSYDIDGEFLDFPPPNGWRDLVKAEADRIGWKTYGKAT